jgi:hypothetical protein
VDNSADVGPTGVGGWLRLVELGLIASPPLALYSLYANYWPVFRDGAWGVLTSPGTEAYHPLWAPLIIFEIIGTLGLASLSAIALLHFMRRSRRTPNLCIALLICGALLPLGGYAAANSIPAVAADGQTGALLAVFQAFVPAMIWIPYFLLSKRVRNTFVR